jgi:hypothetical protein
MQVSVPLVSRSRPWGASIWTDGAIPPDKVDNPSGATCVADCRVVEGPPVMPGANPAGAVMIPGQVACLEYRGAGGRGYPGSLGRSKAALDDGARLGRCLGIPWAVDQHTKPVRGRM